MEKSISTKVWKDDAEKLKEIAKRNGISVSELLRLAVYEILEQKTEIVRELQRIQDRTERKCEELKKVYGLLGRLSNYVNQIARATNVMAKQGTATREEMEEMRKVAGEVLATCMLIENWLAEKE